MLEDSTYIKLAGIDIPSKDHPDKYLSAIADEVYEYAYNNFLKRPLEILYAGEANDYFNSKLVLINRIFLLSKMNYNKHFLERGLGKFINNSNMINEGDFKAASKKAIENNTGIWGLRNINVYEVFDKTQSIEDINSFNEELMRPKPFVYDRNFTRVLLEIPAGILGGVICGTAGAAIVAGTFRSDGAALVLFCSGYIFGNSLGVYLIAKGGNKDLSLTYTATASLIATATAAGIIVASGYDDFEQYGVASIIFAPLLGALVYANDIGYPTPQVRNTTYLNTTNDFKTHYNFYNSKSLKVDLLRISF